jgi:hypothetical protein
VRYPRLLSVAAALALVVLGACNVGNPSTLDAGAGSGSIKVTPKTAQLFACRSTCWSDIPYNMCANQRDDCLAGAGDAQAVTDCHKMSRTCRKERRVCLKACNKPGNQPNVAHVKVPPPADREDGEEPGAPTDDEP